MTYSEVEYEVLCHVASLESYIPVHVSRGLVMRDWKCSLLDYSCSSSALLTIKCISVFLFSNSGILFMLCSFVCKSFPGLLVTPAELLQLTLLTISCGQRNVT